MPRGHFHNLETQLIDFDIVQSASMYIFHVHMKLLLPIWPNLSRIEPVLPKPKTARDWLINHLETTVVTISGGMVDCQGACKQACPESDCVHGVELN